MPDQFLDIGPPLGGLNLDTSSPQLDANESPRLENVLLHEAGQMRPRSGWKRVVNWRSLMDSPDDLPYGVWQWRNRVLVAMTKSYVTWSPYYFGDGYSLTNTTPTGPIGTPYGIVVNADDPNAITTGTFTRADFEGYYPLTPSVQYENAAYAASAQAFASAKTVNGVEDTFTYPRLVKWAGRYEGLTGLNIHVTVNEGETTATMAGTHAGDLTNYFLRFVSETAGYCYSYQIKRHVPGTATLELYKPYGLGGSPGNKASQEAYIRPLTYIHEGPIGAAVVGVHQERLWAGRAITRTAIGDIQAGEYRNAITWSEPGNPEKWPDQNILILDDRPDEKIMGFGKLGRNLVIFCENRIYELTGTSEDNYSPRLLTDEMGCVDARSIVQYRHSVGFMSQYGYFIHDGAQLIDLTQPRPGHGIRSAYKQSVKSLNDRSAGNAALVDDYLLYSMQGMTTTPPATGYYCFLPSGAWAQWGSGPNLSAPRLFTLNGQKIHGKTWGITQRYAVELDQMFETESEAYQRSTSSAGPKSRYDECYNDTTGAAEDVAVQVRINFKDFRLFGGDTGRLRKLFLEHNVCYPSQTGEGDFTGYRVYTMTDPEYTDVTAGGDATLEPRRTFGLYFDPSDYYTTELPAKVTGSAVAARGAILRVALTYAATDGTPAHSQKIFGLRLQVETTRAGRVDNAVH